MNIVVYRFGICHWRTKMDGVVVSGWWVGCYFGGRGNGRGADLFKMEGWITKMEFRI